MKTLESMKQFIRENNFTALVNGSPSSRRAWIEIVLKQTDKGDGEVALLAEGVDRNVVPV